jgi:hypothetical protein
MLTPLGVANRVASGKRASGCFKLKILHNFRNLPNRGIRVKQALRFLDGHR